jgi:hypothetical protein
VPLSCDCIKDKILNKPFGFKSEITGLRNPVLEDKWRLFYLARVLQKASLLRVGALWIRGLGQS